MAAVLALAGAGEQTPPPLEFTRPTVIAVRLDAEPRFQRFLHEDDAYTFGAHYGTAGRPERPGLFAYSKRRRAWIEILYLSTEHARLGRSPDMSDMPLSIAWDYGHLIDQLFTREPWAPGHTLNFPDRFLDVSAPAAYRLDFNSSLNREVSLTSLWLLKSDLEAAFEGRRTPAEVAPDRVTGPEIRMALDDGLIVPVQINDGGELRWRIDTKVPGILLDGTAARLRVPADITQARFDLTLGSVTMASQLVTPGRASKHNNLGGLLGSALFDRFVVVLDYDGKSIRLLEPDAVIEPSAGDPVPIGWANGAPTIFGQLETEGPPTTNVRLCVDTVEPRPLVLRQPLAAARVKSLRIGSFRFDNLPVVADPTLSTDCDGVVGNGLLKRFRVTFDRRRQRVLLLPGALIDVPYDYDLTGLTIVANGRAFGIGSVIHASIADVAGLRAGDVIVELDGRAVAGRSLAELRRLFQPDGRARTLTIQRRGSTHVVTLLMPILK